MPETHITTFYSFKGGVGRTMLLANVGAALALEGKKVLLIDLDVEAPGMHHIPDLQPNSPVQRGFLEWLLHLQKSALLKNTDDDQLEKLHKLRKRCHHIPGLYILPAFGSKDPAVLYQEIDWHGLLVKDPSVGLNFFKRLTEYLAGTREYHHILLDARTGVTDLGGLMTAVLPHSVVLVGGYGCQNTQGLGRIHKALRKIADKNIPQRSSTLPKLNLLRVVSPVPNELEKLRNIRRAQLSADLSPDEMETLIEIPFEPQLLFEEKLLCRTQPDSRIAMRYRLVAEKIDNLREEQLRLMHRVRSTDSAYPDVGIKSDYSEPWQNKGDIFEDKVAKLLTLLGYKVDREQLVDGNRVDLIARQETGLRPECFLVECKDHAKPIGKAVLEKMKTWLTGDKAGSMRAEGMIVARDFSLQARTFADAVPGIVLFTLEELEQRLIDFGPYLARIKRNFEESILAHTYVPQRCLSEDDSVGDRVIDPLQHGLSWAQGTGSRLWLLLGDYGTGKTSFFKRFTYELAIKAEKGEGPVPIAIELKNVSEFSSLESLLQGHFGDRLDWYGNPETILYLLETGKVALLLDAFDEMGTAAIGRKSGEQFRQLARASSTGRANRVLITCRTHYFKDQQNVRESLHGYDDHLITDDSELGKLAQSFDASVNYLLPFNPEQIRRFLEKQLEKNDIDRALQFIKSTYDLSSLATRPVLLEMIIRTLPSLMRGKGRMSPAGLYHRYTTLWLDGRSGVNLTISAGQRKKLLELLAGELWNRQGHRIHYRELIDLVTTHKPGELAGVDPERIDLELRTAAFLIRSPDGFYSFSHKSFLEFFFARNLNTCLLNSDGFAAALDNEPLTPELTAFFADILNNNEQHNDIEKLKGVLSELLTHVYHPRSSENGLRLALYYSRYSAKREGYKQATKFMKNLVPDAMHLQGARLAEEDLRGAWLAGADLSGANLRGADLREVTALQCIFSGADLSFTRLDDGDYTQAHFRAADLSHATLKRAKLREADFSRADCTASLMVHTQCERAKFINAVCYATRFAFADCTHADFTGADLTSATGPHGVRSPLDEKIPRQLIAHQLHRHNNTINCVAFSHDDRLIATAGTDHTAIIWDARSCIQLCTLIGHKGPVNSIFFSNNSEKVLTASFDCSAILWETKTGKQLKEITLDHDNINYAEFDKLSQRILTTGGYSAPMIWNVETGTFISTLFNKVKYILYSVFSKDWQQAISVGPEGTVIVWDVQTGKQIHVLGSHEEGVKAACFDYNGKYIATANSDHAIIIWNVQTGKKMRTLTGHHNDVTSISFDKNSQAIISASSDNTAIIWDADTGERIRILDEHKAPIKTAVFSNNGKHIVTAGKDGQIVIWDTETWKRKSILQEKTNSQQHGFFSPNGKKIITSGRDKNAVIWDAQNGRQLFVLKGHTQRVRSAVFSPDDKYIVTTGYDCTAIIHDARTGNRLNTLIGHKMFVLSATFDRKSKLIVTTSADQTAILWDAKTGKKLRQFSGHNHWVHWSSFDSQSKKIVTTGSDHKAIVWDIESGRQLWELKHTAPVHSAIFDHNFDHIVTSSYDHTVVLWDGNTGKKIRTFNCAENIIFFTDINHLSTKLVVAGFDNVALVLDIETGETLLNLEGHHSSISCAAFSPDSDKIVTTGMDNNIIIWDAETGEKLLTITQTPNGWYSLDEQGRYRSGGDGLQYLGYKNPRAKETIPTIWAAEDLPEMRAQEQSG